MKLKDYPHLMMELFEVAAGNWCVVAAAAAVSRIDNRISQWLFVVLANSMATEWSMVIHCCGKFYNFLVLSTALKSLNFGSNLTLFGLGPSSFGSYLIWSSLVIIAIENFMLHHCRCKANMRQCFLFLMSTNPPHFQNKLGKSGDVCPGSGLISALIVVVRWRRKH